MSGRHIVKSAGRLLQRHPPSSYTKLHTCANAGQAIPRVAPLPTPSNQQLFPTPINEVQRKPKTLHFMPAKHFKQDIIDNATASHVFFDMEDAVPIDSKQIIRDYYRNLLSKTEQPRNSDLWFRINRVGDGDDWYHDLCSLAMPPTKGFMVPKVSSVEDIDQIDCVLRDIEKKQGLGEGHYKLCPAAECAQGMLKCVDIVASSTRVEMVIVGNQDSAVEMRCNADSQVNHQCFKKLRQACAAAGVDVTLFGAFIRLDSNHGYQAQMEACRRIGFAGSACLSQRQSIIAHRTFSKSQLPETSSQQKSLHLKTTY